MDVDTPTDRGTLRSSSEPEMRFWYIIPNLLWDLLTTIFEQVQGLTGSP